MATDQRILIVDDDPQITAGLAAFLEPDWNVRTAASGREALVAFADFSPDIVVLDVILPDATGIELLHQLKMYSETASIILMSGGGTLDQVVEGIKLGAEQFLQKPFELDALLATLEQSKRTLARDRELLGHRHDTRREDRLPGISPAVAQLNDLLPQLGRVHSPVLIEGEPGTGKEIYARLIHRYSPRADGPFVVVACAGLSKEMLEAELFGVERGALAWATTTQPGLFETASEGTLFFDEIGELDPTSQARLIRVLEERRFRRLGGMRDLETNFRLIAASNRDLARESIEKRFRTDLYYRLNVMRVRMPPLRERPEDVAILADEIIRPLAKTIGIPKPKISRIALRKLAEYTWPGNVRELRNVLERALVTSDAKVIRTENLHLDVSAADLVRDADATAVPKEEWQIRPLDAVITDYVTGAVEATGGNVRKAARMLQVSPSTVYARLRPEPE